MNVLILGSGGREHTFAWKISQSPLCNKLYIAPGNAGTQQHGTNIAINPMDFEAVKKLTIDENIQLVLVGPEAPLVAGIYDFFKKDAELKHISVIGPSAKGAQLEGSKAFSKAFMAKRNIPTAGYQEFTQATLQEGLAYIEQQTPPIVLKADGLAAGKGVLILNDVEEAKMEFSAMLDGKFGAASEKVVIEDFLDGIEFSVFVLTDGTDYQVLPIAKDYKRIGEGDTGLNTGGMGAVSPVPFVNEELMQKVTQRIIIPTVKGIAEDELEYKGFVFIGLIKVGEEPFVIEYNCRMGDPETEVVLPRLENDLLELLIALAEGKLNEIDIKISEKAATTIMLVSGGYPEAYEKGKTMTGFEKVTDSILFHAGTKQVGNEIITNGGRVLAITSYGDDFKTALTTSNKNAALIEFDEKNYRKDIGFDL
ncbi:MAG: phosphoribosylamine--glycine ligase [Saprospiraceae bacterium]